MKREKVKMSDDVKFQRMMLWFEASLPEHDVGKWFFEIEPRSIPVVDERGEGHVYDDGGFRTGLLVGHGESVRCGRRYDLDRCGNFGTYKSVDQTKLIQNAKEWILRGVQGKCWGEVPEIPEPSHYASFASIHDEKD